MPARHTLGLIYALSLTLASAAAFADGDEKGFVPLFNGENLDGWQGDLDGHSVEDGKLICAGGRLFTKKVYENFVFRFEFKTVAGGNNGVGIRTPATGNPAYEGMEIQILDNDHPKYAGIKEWQRHGSIYGVAAAKKVSLKPGGEWNSEEIRAEGSRIKVTFNGEVIVDVDIAKIEPIDGKKHPGLLNKKGHIGFLGHGARFEMRNLRILELPAGDGTAE